MTGFDSVWLTSVAVGNLWLENNEKEFKLHTLCSGISKQIKPLQLVGLSQAADFKFES